MDKLTMAHEWAMKYGEVDTIDDRESMVIRAWQYVDAMQAEADKRSYPEIPDSSKERQPDYSEKPNRPNGVAFPTAMSMQEFRNACIKLNHIGDAIEIAGDPDNEIKQIKSALIDAIKRKYNKEPAFPTLIPAMIEELETGLPF